MGKDQVNPWTEEGIKPDIELIRILNTLDQNDYNNYKSVLNYLKTGNF